MKISTKKIISTIILVTVISFTSNAQTTVSGGIYANTTWTLANSPYTADTVIVYPNVTLTIEPGVTVIVNGNLHIQQGSLIAEGTAADSITFLGSLPILGDTLSQITVYFYEAHTSRLNYCNIKANPDRGMEARMFSSSDTLTIKNSYFTNNGTGMYDIMGTIILDSCVFKNNSTATNQTIGTITNSIIRQNYNGLSESGAIIQNCVVDSNVNIGIIFEGNTITNCQIKNNGVGIKCDNGGTGISQISNNVVENNNIGIQLANPWGDDSIYCNKICNNTTYNVKMTTFFNRSVAYNYWCTNDSLTIAGMIHDGYDSAGLGLVNFMPIDTSQCYLSGCLLSVSASVTNATCDTCHNGSATANPANGSPPYTYTWYTTPVQTTQTATGLSAGTYTFCITDANGCTACNSALVDSTNCTGFTINTNASNATCTTCNDGFAWVNVTGGTTPYYYTWYTTPIQTTDTATSLLQGDYLVCVTDFYGCSACDSLTVSTGNCSAHFNLNPDTIAHHYYAINMASGISPLTYSWNWGDGSPNDTIPYPDHIYAIAGSYTICLTITDSAGCTNTYCNSYYLMRSTNTMVYVNVITQTTTGISETSVNSNISLFPNPADNYLTYSLGPNIAITGIKIFNLLGELEFSSEIKSPGHIIDISTLSNGIHILEISSDKNIIRRKFIKQ